MHAKRSPLDRLTELLLERPRWVWLALGLILLASLAMGSRLVISDSMEEFMDRTLPSQRVLESLEANFNSERFIFISYETADVFSAPALRAVRKLSKSIEEVTLEPEGKESFRPFDDVVSLTTIKDVVGKEMSLEVRPLVPDPVPDEAEALANIKRRAERNAVIHETLVSERSDTVAGIVVRLKREITEADTHAAVGALRDLVAQSEQEGPLRIHMTGHPIVETDFPSLLVRDTLTITPVLFVLIVLFLGFLLRRMAGVLLTVGLITVGTSAGVAMVPLSGSVFNGLYASMPPLLMVVCVAISLHFVCEAGREMETAPGHDPRWPVMRMLIRPVLMSCTTTSIGFLTLVVADVRAIREFGLGLALAVFVCGFVALIYMGAIWSRWSADRFISPRAFALSPTTSRGLERLATMAIRHSLVLVVICAIGTGFMVWGVSQLVVSESAIAYFERDHPVHEGAVFFEPHLGGSSPLILSIRTEEPGRLLRPEELAKFEKLEEFLRSETPIDRTTSIATIMKISHRAFFAEDDEKYVLPETKAQAAQLLLLNTDDRVEEFIDPAHMWARVVTRMPVHRTDEQRVVYAKVREYVEKNFPADAGYDAGLASDHLVFAQSVSNNNKTLSTSLSSSLVIIFFLFVVLFRSVKVALFSLLPNLFPVVTAMGLLGWIDGDLSVTTAAIAAILLGIAIDDTVHFIECYRHRLGSHGNIERALRETVYTKGPAITFTSVIFAAGFLTFLLADFVPLQLLGLYLAIGMVAAFLGDAVFLPALIKLTGARLGVPLPPAAVEGEAPPVE